MPDHQTFGDSSIRVLVADGSPIHTHLLADALKRDPGLEVMAFEGNPAELLSFVEEQETQILLLNANLEEQPGAGFEVLKGLRASVPGIRAIILLDSSADEEVLQAFRAGAKGVFSKEQPAQMLGKCIHSVHQGQIWANSHEMTIAIEALASAPVVRAVNATGMNLLSKRELQVVRSLAEGLTNREIAERLKLSQHTVKNYLFRVFDKLGVSSRVELLFMTLSQSASGSGPLASGGPVADHLPPDFAPLLKAAEAGLPAAQIALSQMYLARQQDPQDLVSAYTWLLIANQQASLAGDRITQKMSPEQISQAKSAADTCLARMESSSVPADAEAEKIEDRPKSPPKRRGRVPAPKRAAQAKEAYLE